MPVREKQHAADGPRPDAGVDRTGSTAAGTSKARGATHRRGPASTGATKEKTFRVSIDPKKAAAIGGGVLVLGAAAFFLLGKSPAEVVRDFAGETRCPLTDEEP